ncbi:MAG TPA: cystathionine beta-lyase [Burkholderiaceae bacterium]|nr:cystathionine beta-lyase [Burkholderiaceae bacterium]
MSGKTPERPGTTLVTAGRDRATSFDFVNPPLVRGSTVLHDDVEDMRARVSKRQAGDDRPPVAYGIYGSPTHHAFCDAVNALEAGQQTWALPSGLAACTIAILAHVRHGDHVLVPDSVYWPTRRFCRETLVRYGIATTFYDPRAGAQLESLFRPSTRVLYLESPGSHTFEMQDVPLLASIAQRRGAISVIDNTWATPLYFQPLRHGVDVSVHAATKYIGGHSDLLIGTVTCNARAAPAVRETVQHFGLTTSPDDCWLALRGLRSMAARLPRHRANAERLIAWLRRQDEVERILYPAAPEDPGHAIWQRDMSGATGLFGVVLKPFVSHRAAEALVDAVRLFGRGYSWGGFESLLIPASPERTATVLPWTGPLLRIAAGLEEPDDLIADLERGFASLRQAVENERGA